MICAMFWTSQMDIVGGLVGREEAKTMEQCPLSEQAQL